MISDLNLLKIYGAMARHAAESQSVSAANIARANEPGFKASEMESFEAYLARAARARRQIRSRPPSGPGSPISRRRPMATRSASNRRSSTPPKPWASTTSP